MKKYIALLLALVLMLMLGLAACGGGGGENTNNPNGGNSSNPNNSDSGNNPPAGDPGEITYWSMWNSGEPQATVIQAAAAAFETQTGVHVNIEWKGRDINTLLSASLEAKENIDLFDDDYTRIGQIYADHTYDLTEMAAADYANHSYPVLVDQTIKWAGHLNCIVEQPTMGGVFYNKDLFNQAGITADPSNECTALPGAKEALLAADANMSWCGELNTHPAWATMKGELMPKLFEGAYATGEDFCAAMDALY